MKTAYQMGHDGSNWADKQLKETALRRCDGKYCRVPQRLKNPNPPVHADKLPTERTDTVQRFCLLGAF